MNVLKKIKDTFNYYAFRVDQVLSPRLPSLMFYSSAARIERHLKKNPDLMHGPNAQALPLAILLARTDVLEVLKKNKVDVTRKLRVMDENTNILKINSFDEIRYNMLTPRQCAEQYIRAYTPGDKTAIAIRDMVIPFIEKWENEARLDKMRARTMKMT